MTLFRWSRTAANNATIDVTAPFPEGMAASALNDSSRGQMAAIAKYRDDVAGAITTGGTATAYTVTSFQGFDTLANLNGQNIAFVPHATNTNAVGVDVTLSVDSLGNKPIRMAPSVALPNGTLILGTPYIVTYNNSDGVFYLQNMTNPYIIPLAGAFDYWGATAPNSSFALAFGQALSRTTYATLFNLFGTTHGVGDGSTTFNIPDKRGRASFGADNMGGSAASRLTAASGMVSGAIGQTGGGETNTLITANLPAYTPTGTITNGAITTTGTVNGSAAQAASTVGSGTAGGLSTPVNAGALVLASSQASSTFTGAAQGGTSTAFANVPPAICCNYLIRVI